MVIVAGCHHRCDLWTIVPLCDHKRIWYVADGSLVGLTFSWVTVGLPLRGRYTLNVRINQSLNQSIINQSINVWGVMEHKIHTSTSKLSHGQAQIALLNRLFWISVTKQLRLVMVALAMEDGKTQSNFLSFTYYVAFTPQKRYSVTHYRAIDEEKRCTELQRLLS